MELMEAIYHRRAVRTFTAAAVDRPRINTLVDAASHAPSAMNLQPWLFAVVEGAARLADYSTRAKRHLLATMPPNSPMTKYRAMLEDTSFNIFYGAPCLIVICARPPVQQSMEDCCLAGQNLMLAAHGQGLGTCWIGFSRPWLELADTRAELRLPPDCLPVAPIIVGVPTALPAAPEHHNATVIWCETAVTRSQ